MMQFCTRFEKCKPSLTYQYLQKDTNVNSIPAGDFTLLISHSRGLIVVETSASGVKYHFDETLTSPRCHPSVAKFQRCSKISNNFDGWLHGSYAEWVRKFKWCLSSKSDHTTPSQASGAPAGAHKLTPPLRHTTNADNDNNNNNKTGTTPQRTLRGLTVWVHSREEILWKHLG